MEAAARRPPHTPTGMARASPPRRRPRARPPPTRAPPERRPVPRARGRRWRRPLPPAARVAGRSACCPSYAGLSRRRCGRWRRSRRRCPCPTIQSPRGSAPVPATNRPCARPCRRFSWPEPGPALVQADAAKRHRPAHRSGSSSASRPARKAPTRRVSAAWHPLAAAPPLTAARDPLAAAQSAPEHRPRLAHRSPSRRPPRRAAVFVQRAVADDARRVERRTAPGTSHRRRCIRGVPRHSMRMHVGQWIRARSDRLSPCAGMALPQRIDRRAHPQQLRCAGILTVAAPAASAVSPQKVPSRPHLPTAAATLGPQGGSGEKKSRRRQRRALSPSNRPAGCALPPRSLRVFESCHRSPRARAWYLRFHGACSQFGMIVCILPNNLIPGPVDSTYLLVQRPAVPLPPALCQPFTDRHRSRLILQHEGATGWCASSTFERRLRCSSTVL